MPTDIFEEWFKRIRDKNGRDSILVRLDRVQEGNFGDCESVGDGVHELRIHVGSGYRVYFGEDGNTVVILGGSQKQNQDAQIRRAQARWREYNA